MKYLAFVILLSGSSFVFGAADDWGIQERGAHYRQWQRIEARTNDVGQVQYATNSYIELETGMHYRREGEWVAAEEKIELSPVGASATKGQHSVNFAANINTAGAIDLTTSDGNRMRSHVLGLSYFDTATGKSALIAEIKDSIGILTPPNQVIYPDAFTDIKADLRYTYTKAGFEQDVILRQQPPSPAEYGLNANSTRLEILTEFIEAPAPVIVKGEMKDGATDQRLRFGSMSMGHGIAFLIGSRKGATNNAIGLNETLPVAKQWTQMEGRTFLIESVKFDTIEPKIESLPKQEAKVGNLKTERAAKLKRQLPALREARVSNEKLRVASIAKSDPGFVIDYSVVSGSTNFTFKGDTTYYVTGPVLLSGTTIIEGGTVVKFTNSTTAQIAVG